MNLIAIDFYRCSEMAQGGVLALFNHRETDRIQDQRGAHEKSTFLFFTRGIPSSSKKARVIPGSKRTSFFFFITWNTAALKCTHHSSQKNSKNNMYTDIKIKCYHKNIHKLFGMVRANGNFHFRFVVFGT